MENKRDLAIAIEETALELDERIVNVPYAFYGESTGDSLLGNSYGVLKDYRYAYCSVMATEGETTEIGSHVSVATDFKELDAAHIAKHAVQKALDRIGGTEPDSGSYSVVFDEEAATSLIGAFVAGGVSPFFGENIQKGRSKLDGRLGERIGSEAFTLIDDPMSGIAPRPFDGEGVATSRIAFVDAGVFSSVIHNLYSATRGASTSTGHADRAGYRGGIGTALHNPYLTNGELSFDELIERTGEGILINSVEGLHSGLNPVSGDFSVGAKGFAIQKGRLGAPLKNMVVAGNFYELIDRIDAKASDRRIMVHEPFSSPSILVSDLSVSGA
jgi:PmbA protein